MLPCLLLAIAGALVVWAISAHGSQAAKPRSITLEAGADPPDLAEQVPSRLGVVTIHAGGRKYYALAFQSVAENLAKNGDGEMYLVGHRPSPNVPMMTADQYINVKDPHTGSIVSQQVIPDVGQLKYERFLVGHDHWHYVNFENYTLYQYPSYRLFAIDHKIGFCLVSDHQVPDPGFHGRREGVSASAAQAGGMVSYQDDTPGCGKHKANLTRVVESLDPGGGDVYEPYLGGQNVDITGARNGRYVLVIHVNPARALVESNYNNDYASMLISIHRSSSRAKPTFKVLKRCPNSARCPA